MNGRPSKKPAVIYEEITRLHSAGMSDQEIGAHVGLHPSTIAQRRTDMRLPTNLVTRVSDSAIRELHAQGLTDVEIARRYKVASQNVGTRRRILGLPAVPPRAKLTTDRLVELHGQGMSDYAIAKPCGVDVTTVNHRRRALGLPVNGHQKRSSYPASILSDEQLRELHALGLTDAEIASKVGLNSSRVNVRRRALGLPTNPKSKVTDEVIRHAKNAGLQDSDIAKVTGLSDLVMKGTHQL